MAVDKPDRALHPSGPVQGSDLAVAVDKPDRALHPSGPVQGSDLAVARVVVVGVPRGTGPRSARQLRRIEAAYAAARESGQRAAVVATPRLTMPGLTPRRAADAGLKVLNEGCLGVLRMVCRCCG